MIDTNSSELSKVVGLLRNLHNFAKSQICTHEETHRAGAIWTVCSICGAKWADDGDAPVFCLPEPLQAAEDYLRKLDADAVAEARALAVIAAARVLGWTVVVDSANKPKEDWKWYPYAPGERVAPSWNSAEEAAEFVLRRQKTT